MRVDWCVSSWFRIKNTHSLTPTTPTLGTLEVLEVDILWPRWVARIGVTMGTGLARTGTVRRKEFPELGSRTRTIHTKTQPRTIHTTDKAQTTASLEAIVLATRAGVRIPLRPTPIRHPTPPHPGRKECYKKALSKKSILKHC